MRRILLIFLLPAAAWSSAVIAAAPVVDIDNRAPTVGPATPDPSDRPVGSSASQPQSQGLFPQVQQLQDEVRELRGIIEEQANEIQLLKKRQLDDYQNLDGRITKLTSGPNSGGPRGPDTDPSYPSQGDAGPSDTGQGEVPPIDANDTRGLSGDTGPPSPKQRAAAGDDADPQYQQYSAAYDLLKNRRIDEAENKFRQYVASYPDGNYAANAHYWLGEISLLENQLDSARKEFAIVVEKYPNDRKAEDAGFKLGKVYHLLGDNAKAKAQLNKAAAGTGTSARLAQAYLRENF